MIKFKDGFYSDVRIETRFNTAIRYRNGVLEECKQTTVKKAFIRVFDGEMWYYSSTYKLDGLQGELDKLYANATPNPKIAEDATVKRFQANVAKIEKFKDCSLENVPLAEKQKLLTSNFEALNSSEYVKMTVALYSDRHSNYEIGRAHV